MRAFNLRHVDFHAKPGSPGNSNEAVDYLKRFLGQALPVLPDPMRVYGGDFSRARRPRRE